MRLRDSSIYLSTIYLKEKILFMQMKYMLLAAKPFDLWSIFLKAIPENILSFTKTNDKVIYYKYIL